MIGKYNCDSKEEERLILPGEGMRIGVEKKVVSVDRGKAGSYGPFFFFFFFGCRSDKELKS